MTPARLRNWILLFAVALMVAIAAFFLHARWLGRRLGRDIPAELAKTIQQSTQGFTHSESRGGHTIYSLHASKAVQFKSDGHAELHDVSITLYNAQGAPANRIYGRAFDWDPVHGVARALGEVEIDFQGDATPNAKPGTEGTEEGESKNTVHLKTSGLVFNKQTGLAATPERIEFRTSAAAGSAVGASFNSQTGIMIFTSEVTFNSSVGGSPLLVHAHHAQFDRETRLVYLLDEVTDFQDNHSSSDEATIAFRPDGSASRVDAEGNVVLSGSNGQKINTRKLHVDLDAKSAPLRASAEGGLLYTSSESGRSLHGTASSGVMLIGPQMTLRHAQLQDAVSLVDVETYTASAGAPAKAKASPPVSSARAIQATRMDVDFVTGPDRSPQAKNIVAVGAARLNVHTIFSNTAPQDTTVQGDQLTASLVDGEVLSSLRGSGHTSLVDVSPTGVKQSTSGDTLLLTFAESQDAATSKKRTSSEETTASMASHAVAQLRSAVQQGHVTLSQEVTGKASAAKTPPQMTRAVAERAEYDAVSQVIQLSGSPRVMQAGADLSAVAITMEHATGNATATGGVKATYRSTAAQPNVAFAGSGVVHIVADRAHLDHSTDLAVFYGTPAAAARMWQGSDSVAAPIIELSQAQSTLSAHGIGDAPAAVSAVFISAPANAAPRPVAAGASGAESVIRVQSRMLVYSDSSRKATFSGAVVAQTTTGTLRANTMDVFLAAASTSHSSGGAPGQQSSSIERIVARGRVELQQPGRKGTGEELVYTAADSQFVLTGTPEKPPRLSDQVQGNVVGTSLIFKDRDDSVIVSGGTQKTVTQTRVAK